MEPLTGDDAGGYRGKDLVLERFNLGGGGAFGGGGGAVAGRGGGVGGGGGGGAPAMELLVDGPIVDDGLWSLPSKSSLRLFVAVRPSVPPQASVLECRVIGCPQWSTPCELGGRWG